MENYKSEEICSICNKKYILEYDYTTGSKISKDSAILVFKKHSFEVTSIGICEECSYEYKDEIGAYNSNIISSMKFIMETL